RQAGFFPPLRFLYRPQNNRLAIPLASACRCFCGHDPRDSTARPRVLANYGDSVSGRYRGDLRALRCGSSVARLSDGLLRSNGRTPTGFWKLFAAPANWRARDGFSVAQSALPLDGVCLFVWNGRLVFPFLTLRN